MNKNRIRLSESQLHRIVMEALNEYGGYDSIKQAYGEQGDTPYDKHLKKVCGFDKGYFKDKGRTPEERQKMDDRKARNKKNLDPLRLKQSQMSESRLNRTIKESIKRVLSEGGHLTWKDDDGKMHTNSKDTWYGVEGSTFVSHGSWSDGEIYFDYQGEQYVINATDAEDWLWNDFKEYCEENGINPDEHYDDEVWDLNTYMTANLHTFTLSMAN